MHKKNLPPERNGSNLFLIYPNSHSLHRFLASLSVTQPSFLVADECMRKQSNIVFVSYYPEDLRGPSHPSVPQPPALPFYLFRLPRADAVISPALNNLSHPLASPVFKSCLPPHFWMHSLRFPIPAGRRSQRCQTWRKGRSQHKGSE